MRVKHTIGPWQVSDAAAQYPGISSAEGDILVVPSATDMADTGVYGETQAQALANARLMAAAPKLLEVLKSALRCIAAAAPGAFRNGNTHPDNPNGADEDEALTIAFVARAYALIAETEGE